MQGQAGVGRGRQGQAGVGHTRRCGVPPGGCLAERPSAALRGAHAGRRWRRPCRAALQLQNLPSPVPARRLAGCSSSLRQRRQSGAGEVAQCSAPSALATHAWGALPAHSGRHRERESPACPTSRNITYALLPANAGGHGAGRDAAAAGGGFHPRSGHPGLLPLRQHCEPQNCCFVVEVCLTAPELATRAASVHARLVCARLLPAGDRAPAQNISAGLPCAAAARAPRNPSRLSLAPALASASPLQHPLGSAQSACCAGPRLQHPLCLSRTPAVPCVLPPACSTRCASACWPRGV